MQPSSNPPSIDCQVNVRLSREHFELVKTAAEKYDLSPVQYCRAAAIAALDRDLPSTDTPFFNAVASLLGHLPDDLAHLHRDFRDFKDARACEAGVLAEVALRTLATLEEVQGLRIILINTVGILARREPFTDADLDELLATADGFKARNAQRSIHALTTRLQADTPPETQPETPADTPRTQDHTHA